MAEIGSGAGNEAVRPLVLVGLPGVGKTRAGRLLARRINWSFADIDHEIERATGRTVATLVAGRGWPYFRDLEQDILASFLGRSRIVIASGGGIVEREANRAAIRRDARAIWLRADPALLLQRLRSAADERPLLAGDAGGRLDELARNREPLYAEVAEARLDIGTLNPEDVAEKLLGVIGLEQTGAIK